MKCPPSQVEIAAHVVEVWGASEDGKALVSFAPSDLVSVRAHCLETVDHVIREDARWISLVAPDRSRCLICVLHAFSSTGDAELIPVGGLGQLRREMRRCLAWWAFNVIGLRRVTVRIRGRDRRLQEFARRLGLRHEGTQRAFYGPGEDCSLWGITHDEARLLLKREPAAAPAPSNTQVH